MLNVQSILDLLPWVLIAPAIPLLLILINKAYGNGRQTSLILLCVITIISHIFLIAGSRSSMNPVFLHTTFLATFIFTLFLLKNCTDHQILRISILTILLIFISIYLGLQYLPGDPIRLYDLNTTGAFIIFLLAILVLTNLATKVDRHILHNPDFWYTGGVFFYFGLLSLMLFTGKKVTDIDYHEQDQWSALYAIIFCLQFLFFSVGVWVHKPWREKTESSL